MDQSLLGSKRRRPAFAAAVAGAIFISSVAALAVWRQLRPTPEPSELAAVFNDGPGGPFSPLAKRVVVGMDTNINFHTAFDDWPAWSKEMQPFWTEDMIYDFSYVGDWNFRISRGLREWFDSEHMHWNKAIPDCQWQDFIRAASHSTATSASYGLGQWVGDLAGVPPPASRPLVRVRDLDFYLLEGDRIKINWCIVDMVDLLHQVGYRVLPPGPLTSEGHTAYSPPHAEDGFPAPLSELFTPEDAAASESTWRAALEEDYLNATGQASHWAANALWYGPAGVGTAYSRRDYLTHFLQPLHAAFSNITMKTDMVVCEGPYCGAHFYVWGDHTGSWLGAPATGNRVPIRCGAHGRVVNGVLVEGWLIIDIPRAFHAMGIDLFARAKTIAASMSEH